MFNWFSKKAPRKPLSFPDWTDFEAAGVLFTDKRIVLGGWQPRKAMPKVSGIGGLRNGDEPYMVTALREMVEELYGCAEVPVALLHKLMNKFEPVKVFRNQTYITVVYSFDQLAGMLECINKAGIITYYYVRPPKNHKDLIFKRQKSATAEVESFALLPVAMFDGGCIDPDFVADVKIYKNLQDGNGLF